MDLESELIHGELAHDSAGIPMLNVYQFGPCKASRLKPAHHSHSHPVDHIILLSHGSIYIPWTTENTSGEIKLHVGINRIPLWISMLKGREHKIFALEDDTIFCCVFPREQMSQYMIAIGRSSNG